ncbi:MAG: SDR family NAD(P)-dependent oxidoreductase, partial [Oscillospiraceae bacterium]
MNELFDLTGKRALVTGGGRGLGRGMAEGLAEAGATVVILGSSDSVVTVAKELSAKGLKVIPLQGDLSDRAGLPALFEKAVVLLGGGIDILVNNAGVQRRNRCEEFTLEDWDAVMGVNLDAVFVLCQLAGRKMLAQ